ncbi:MAG: cysteine-rich small domain-containing protein [Lachnospiraceae bacterium]|nr:cysteine-rich small domain-containing protein [Lachnospiraceae bacterium]
MTKKYSYFAHRDCEYFPCHREADPDNFNCLFCYCPLYLLGDKCGGQFVYLRNGRKDCSYCLYPHLRENYEDITMRYREIAAAMPSPDKKEDLC